MKERLTKRLDNGSVEYENREYIIRLYPQNEDYYNTEQKAILRLAEYEDAEEQGLLKRLPCKVGDDCYFVTKVAEEYELLCGLVISICIDNGGIWFSCRYSVGMSYWHNSKDKDLFFTLPEAEKKLKELKFKDRVILGQSTIIDDEET